MDIEGELGCMRGDWGEVGKNNTFIVLFDRNVRSYVMYVLFIRFLVLIVGNLSKPSTDSHRNKSEFALLRTALKDT